MIIAIYLRHDDDDEWRDRERQVEAKTCIKHAKALPFFSPSSLNWKLGEQTTHNKKEKEKKGWKRTRHLCDAIKLALLGSQRDKEETEQQQPSERGWRMAYRRRAYYHLFIYYCRRHNTMCCCCCCLLYANNTHNSTNNNNSAATTTII